PLPETLEGKAAPWSVTERCHGDGCYGCFVSGEKVRIEERTIWSCHTESPPLGPSPESLRHPHNHHELHEDCGEVPYSHRFNKQVERDRITSQHHQPLNALVLIGGADRGNYGESEI